MRSFLAVNGGRTIAVRFGPGSRRSTARSWLSTLATDGDWREACRTYARGFTEAVLATGPLAEHLQVTAVVRARFLETTEALRARLGEAGLDDATAIRSLTLLMNLCFGHARDVLGQVASTDHAGTRCCVMFCREQARGTRI